MVLSIEKEGDGADRWAQHDLTLAGCDRRDQGITRTDAIGQARASIDRHGPHGRSAINGKAMVSSTTCAR